MLQHFGFRTRWRAALVLHFKGGLALAVLAALLQPIYAQGTLKWSYDTGGAIQTSPAIGDDNVIIFSSNDDSVYALNPDGTLQWSVDIGAAARCRRRGRYNLRRRESRWAHHCLQSRRK